MFDNIRCIYPLSIPGANDLDYQTKDTDSQFLDNYEIRADGTFWHQEYNIEDKSDPSAVGIARAFGCLSHVNERWVQIADLTGTIDFYTILGDYNEEWIEWRATFVDGKLHKPVELVEHRFKSQEEIDEYKKRLNEILGGNK